MMIFHCFLLFILPALSSSYYIEVDVSDKACFFEILAKNSKIGIAYEVIQGGFLDIQFVLYDTKQMVLHNEPTANRGRFTFVSQDLGQYSFCFFNSELSKAVKEIKFHVESQKPKQWKSNVEEFNETVTETLLDDLQNYLRYIQYELEFHLHKLKSHHQLNEKINFIVVIWALFEFLFIIGMMVLQVNFIRKWFEVKLII